MKRALIIVDVQNDFIPGGALPTRNGDEVVPVINRLQPLFPLVVATQDWHPPNHGSFASNHPGHKPGDVIDLAGTTHVIRDACRGVELSPGDIERAFEEMRALGVDVISSASFSP